MTRVVDRPISSAFPTAESFVVGCNQTLEQVRSLDTKTATTKGLALIDTMIDASFHADLGYEEIAELRGQLAAVVASHGNPKPLALAIDRPWQASRETRQAQTLVSKVDREGSHQRGERRYFRTFAQSAPVLQLDYSALHSKLGALEVTRPWTVPTLLEALGMDPRRYEAHDIVTVVAEALRLLGQRAVDEGSEAAISNMEGLLVSCTHRSFAYEISSECMGRLLLGYVSAGLPLRHPYINLTTYSGLGYPVEGGWGHSMGPARIVEARLGRQHQIHLWGGQSATHRYLVAPTRSFLRRTMDTLGPWWDRELVRFEWPGDGLRTDWKQTARANGNAFKGRSDLLRDMLHDVPRDPGLTMVLPFAAALTTINRGLQLIDWGVTSAVAGIADVRRSKNDDPPPAPRGKN